MLYANYKAELNKLLNIQKKKYYNDLIYLHKNNMKKHGKQLKGSSIKPTRNPNLLIFWLMEY